MKPDYLKSDTSIKELQKEASLVRIAESLDSMQKTNTFGVVIDISGTLKLPHKSSFLLKLKIIDPTFNFSQSNSNREIRFLNHVCIFIYANKEEELPLVKWVGDILRLRRFNFYVNHKGELCGQMQQFSNWYVIEGIQGTDYKIKNALFINKNANRRVSLFEQERINAIRKWSADFFRQFSLRNFGWWIKQTEPLVLNSLKQSHRIQNADLILRAADQKNSDNSQIFSDEQGTIYSFRHPELPKFGISQVIKFRSFEIIIEADKRVLNVTAHSALLLLRPDFFDSQMFDLSFYEKHKSLIDSRMSKSCLNSPKDSFETRKSVLQVYPFLEDFYFENFLIDQKELIRNCFPKSIKSKSASIVKKNFKNKMPTELNELARMANENLQSIKNYKFLINCKIMKIEKIAFEKIVYVFCKICNFSNTLKNTKNFTCCQNLVSICIVLKLAANDCSLKPNENFSFYIMTREQNKNPFLLWNVFPDLEDFKSWALLDENDFENFRTKLKAFGNFEKEVDLVLESKLTKGNRLFFEVCDTLFLP